MRRSQGRTQYLISPLPKPVNTSSTVSIHPSNCLLINLPTQPWVYDPTTQVDGRGPVEMYVAEVVETGREAEREKKKKQIKIKD
jgi:hypothetical protein